eukprot:scaffold333083_cov34-Prasinocladus_malaysianus.AAC.1
MGYRNPNSELTYPRLLVVRERVRVRSPLAHLSEPAGPGWICWEPRDPAKLKQLVASLSSYRPRRCKASGSSLELRATKLSNLISPEILKDTGVRLSFASGC